MTTEAPSFTNAAAGLSEVEAAEPLARDGPNTLASGRRRALVRQLLTRFQNPLVILLLAASAMEAGGSGAIPSRRAFPRSSMSIE